MAAAIVVEILLAISIGLTLGGDITNVNVLLNRTGTITLNYRGQLTHICHYGEQKNWGKREGDTACKQLGFEGGWPYDVGREEYDSNTQKLNNFDCDETDTDLNDCQYDITDDCVNSRVAGVQCYDSYTIQLVAGKSSNSGRVEVKYDDKWSSVCYESADGSSNDWSFANAQVVCRELGFPGTMFARQGGQGQGTQRYTVNGYQCREDLREIYLGQCYPDSPEPVHSDANSSSCSFETTGESNEAVVICAVPGYIGCHRSDEIDNINAQKMTSPIMTINICRHHCRKLIYRHAILQDGDTCFCANLDPDNLPVHVGDTSCRSECIGDDQQVCGDRAHSSVYDVTTGVCSDPLDSNDVYYFGEIFECDKGMEPVNANAIQCVMGTSNDEFIWNDTCKEKDTDKHSTTTENITGKDAVGKTDIIDNITEDDVDEDTDTIGAAIGASLACVILFLLPIILIAVWILRRRRKKNCHTSDVEQNQNNKKSTHRGLERDNEPKGNTSAEDASKETKSCNKKGFESPECAPLIQHDQDPIDLNKEQNSVEVEKNKNKKFEIPEHTSTQEPNISDSYAGTKSETSPAVEDDKTMDEKKKDQKGDKTNRENTPKKPGNKDTLEPNTAVEPVAVTGLQAHPKTGSTHAADDSKTINETNTDQCNNKATGKNTKRKPVTSNDTESGIQENKGAHEPNTAVEMSREPASHSDSMDQSIPRDIEYPDLDEDLSDTHGKTRTPEPEIGVERSTCIAPAAQSITRDNEAIIQITPLDENW